MIIDLRNLRDGIGSIDGESDSDVFSFSKEDVIQAKTGYRYELDIELFEDLLTLKGKISADFSMLCSRCLERFDGTISLDDYLYAEELEGRAMIDLTNQVREDIVLALPAHPTCDKQGKASVCSADDFVKSKLTSPDQKADKEGVWDALEGWDEKKS